MPSFFVHLCRTFTLLLDFSRKSADCYIEVIMTEKKKTGLSFAQILAGAGSAVTAAYIGTKLGVSGTIIGAAVGSITGTLATHIYSSSLNQGKEALKKAQDITLLSSLANKGASVSSASIEETENTSGSVTSLATPSGTVASTDIINTLVAHDLEELQKSIRTPWYKTSGTRQIFASSGIAMATALGLLYFLGGLDDYGIAPLSGGVSINSIVVETEEPAPAPTIIYIPTPTPEPTVSPIPEEPEDPILEEEDEGSGEKKDLPAPQPSKEPTVIPRPTTPPAAPKPTQEPTSTPSPTLAPVIPTPAPSPDSKPTSTVPDNVSVNPNTTQTSSLEPTVVSKNPQQTVQQTDSTVSIHTEDRAITKNHAVS